MPTRQRGPRVRPLTVYLLKDTVRTARSAIEDPDGLQSFSLRVGQHEATLFIKPSRVAPPQWLDFFEGYGDFSDLFLRNASSSAVLVLPVANRWFAVTFGHGRHLLAQGSWEPNFGLKATLNTIDPDKIRSIDRKSFDAITRHTREEAGRAGSIGQFGLNVEEDLLRAVVGTPEDETLGRRLSGMDALTTTISTTLGELPGLFERYLEQWRKESYRERYPWVDHIGEIRDRRQGRYLDEQLVQGLITGELQHAWLAVPAPLNWSEVGGFRYSASQSAETYDDIHLQTFLGTFQDPTKLSPDALRRRPVFSLDPDGLQPREKWSVYQCLYAELRQDDGVFLLTGGRWYQVERRFARRIDHEIAQLRATDYELPPWERQSEREYNEAVARRDIAVALMDGKNIRHGGGASQVEFCDLLIEGRTLLHVKRYGGADVLSHLFAQGVISATLFLQDQEFRRKVREKLEPAYRLSIPDTRPQAERYEIGFAILSRSAGSLTLPFFSRVNLRNAARTLEGLGYRVTLTKVAATRGVA